MEISNLIPHIEALIFASDKPLTTLEISDLINQAFGFMEDKVTPEQIDAAIQGIVEKYGSEFYPFEVKQSGGGWQFLSKKEYHKTIAQLNGEKFLKRLSAAAMETLAIIAYKQPITKGEIETIRGVSADYAVQKLLEKELIVISGRNEQMPGHPLVYATSKTFMDYFGINTPEDLPKIKEVLAEQLVEPTVVTHTEFEPGTLSVTDDGELIDAEGEEKPAETTGEEITAETTSEEVVSDEAPLSEEAAATEEGTGNEDLNDPTEESLEETPVDMLEDNASPEEEEELNEWQEEVADDENIDATDADATSDEDEDRKRDEENTEDSDSDKESES